MWTPKRLTKVTQMTTTPDTSGSHKNLIQFSDTSAPDISETDKFKNRALLHATAQRPSNPHVAYPSQVLRDKWLALRYLKCKPRPRTEPHNKMSPLPLS